MVKVITIVAAILIAATWIAGWWGGPVVAGVVGALLYARRGISGLVALAAVIAWSVLILVDGSSGRFGVLAGILGATLRLPAAALLAVTLLFAALLAWSATVLGVEIGRARRRGAE